MSDPHEVWNLDFFHTTDIVTDSLVIQHVWRRTDGKQTVLTYCKFYISIRQFWSHGAKVYQVQRKQFILTSDGNV